MQKVLRLEDLSSIKIMEKPQRNEMIKMLRESGYSIRQISRLTGTSKGNVEKT